MPQRYNDIYDRLDDGADAQGSVLEDIAEMDISEMEDYFGDLDPVAFL